MEGLLEVGNLLSMFLTSVPSKTPINLEEDDNVDYNLDQSNSNRVKVLQKKKKERKEK